MNPKPKQLFEMTRKYILYRVGAECDIVKAFRAMKYGLIFPPMKKGRWVWVSKDTADTDDHTTIYIWDQGKPNYVAEAGGIWRHDRGYRIDMDQHTFFALTGEYIATGECRRIRLWTETKPAKGEKK